MKPDWPSWKFKFITRGQAVKFSHYCDQLGYPRGQVSEQKKRTSEVHMTTYIVEVMAPEAHHALDAFADAARKSR